MAVDYAALKAGGFMRQKQKNTFSLRLRCVGGTITTEQLVAIKKVADQYGQGYVHLTARQGVEIPFIKLEDIDAVKAALAEGGVEPGVCGPRVRTVTACQGGRCCPSGCIDALDIARKLDARYFGRELPCKFKFGVTGCINNCLKMEENDFGVKGAYDVSYDESQCIDCGVCAKVCRENAITFENGKLIFDTDKCSHCGRCVKSCPTGAWEGKSAFRVYIGGTFGNHIISGKELTPLIKDEETLMRVADATIDYFDTHSNKGERFGRTLERLGTDELQQILADAVAGAEA